jgi:hypothetical protein
LGGFVEVLAFQAVTADRFVPTSLTRKAFPVATDRPFPDSPPWRIHESAATDRRSPQADRSKNTQN